MKTIVVKGTTSADALARTCNTSAKSGETPLECSEPVASHEAAAEAFCTSTTPVRYYGDVELIWAAVKHWDNSHGTDVKTPCTPAVRPKSEGYEPYVLVISNARVPDLDLRLTLELYRMANEGRLCSILRSHFPGGEISADQESLFRILSVPAGNGDTAPESVAGCRDPFARQASVP